MGAVLLALAASCSWGGADFLGGLTSRKIPTLVVLFLSQCVALALFALLVVITGTDLPLGNDRFMLFAIAGGIGEAIGLAAFYKGMAVGAMGVVAPISACSAIVPVAVGIATGDSLTTREVIGVVAAFSGVVFVGWEPGELGSRGRVAAGVGLALFAALGLGAFFVTISYAVEEADVISSVAVNRAALVLLVGLAVLAAARQQVGTAATMVVPLVTIGVFDIGGATLYAAATGHGLLAIVGAIAALYPIATVLLARFVLKEELALQQRLGAVLGLAGVALIGSAQ